MLIVSLIITPRRWNDDVVINNSVDVIYDAVGQAGTDDRAMPMLKFERRSRAALNGDDQERKAHWSRDGGGRGGC